jgi:hypothetical protein
MIQCANDMYVQAPGCFSLFIHRHNMLQPHVCTRPIRPLSLSFLLSHQQPAQTDIHDLSITVILNMTSSSSHAPSFSQGSLRSSFRRLVPQGYRVVRIQSNTNSTMSGIPGPGRIVGSMLSSVGRSFERAVDRFAEERLGLGPNMAALRLTSALHDIHASEHTECESDHISKLNASEHVIDRLIWVCNGYCSRCYAPYLPQVLDELPERVRKAIQQLIKYLEYVHLFSAVFIRVTIYICAGPHSNYQT